LATEVHFLIPNVLHNLTPDTFCRRLFLIPPVAPHIQDRSLILFRVGPRFLYGLQSTYTRSGSTSERSHQHSQSGSPPEPSLVRAQISGQIHPVVCRHLFASGVRLLRTSRI